jgi:hypothetical protein
VFLHDAVVEGLTEGKSVVAATDFSGYYKQLKQVNPSTQMSGIWEQFQVKSSMSLSIGNKNFKVLTV